jgi:hypothetical protein
MQSHTHAGLKRVRERIGTTCRVIGSLSRIHMQASSSFASVCVNVYAQHAES